MRGATAGWEPQFPASGIDQIPWTFVLRGRVRARLHARLPECPRSVGSNNWCMRTSFSVCDLIPARYDAIGLCSNLSAGAHAFTLSTERAIIIPGLRGWARTGPHHLYWPPASFDFRNGVSKSITM